MADQEDMQVVDDKRWTAMAPADLPQVCAIAEQVHPDFPEDLQIFAERLALAPACCFMLKAGHEVYGYCLAHPWRLGSVPALNRLLGALPEKPDCLYLHDLALLPVVRGAGWAARICQHLQAVSLAQGLDVIALVAVNGSVPFWERQGFAVQPSQDLGSYGGQAALMRRDLA